jgi:hypothetical protein
LKESSRPSKIGLWHAQDSLKLSYSIRQKDQTIVKTVKVLA